MKGLLQKDFYMMVKYCRSFLLLVLVFLAVSFFSNNNLFLILYPTLIVGLLPVTLIAYDEREKWDIYCATLPVTRAQVVSSKYLIGLCFELVIFVGTVAAQLIRLFHNHAFTLDGTLTLFSIVFSVGILGPSLLLPFIFKFGAEKGRVAYYLVMILLCACGTILATANTLQFAVSPAIMSFLSLLLYVASWRLSIHFYQKREL